MKCDQTALVAVVAVVAAGRALGGGEMFAWVVCGDDTVMLGAIGLPTESPSSWDRRLLRVHRHCSFPPMMRPAQ